MTVRNPPVWLQAGAYTAEHDRLVTGLLTDRTTDAAGTSAKLEAGVVPPFGQMLVAPSGNNDMFVNIASGVVIVPRPGIDPPGAYVCHNQGTTSKQFAPAASATRYDTLVARVRDAQVGDAGDSWDLEIQQGVEGGALPTTPVVAGVSVPIAVVAVKPASQNGGTNRITSSQIFDKRVFVSGLGGVHLVWTNTPPEASPGRLLYSVPSKTLFIGNGTSFDAVFSKADLASYFASYRPSATYRGGDVSTANTDWDPLMRDEDTGNQMTERIQISNVVTPSGFAKVTISANGRGDAANVIGNLSFQIRQTSTSALVGGDNSIVRGPNFFSTGWESAQVSVVVQGLPIDKACTVTLFGSKAGSGTGRAFFRRIRMIVEPII